MSKNIHERLEQKGFSYDEYYNLFKDQIAQTNKSELNETELPKFQYKELNLSRTNRIHKTYKPSDKLIESINNISANQTWMVLTEFWCGDSAQNLPYIGEFSKLNANINLRILFRDQNLDIMDMYLTNGTSRSIPKLVSFNESGDELFHWGPRPHQGQSMVSEWKAQGLHKDEFIEKLHLWYAKDKGKSIESEFIELL